ncbi:MAG: type II toxin-antitoxin system prevent-host-death family antitoxin [Coriobacteriia bacterium]|nr:type II toxin-antitoxin system prevent-host-death family antitoxin [Coriobacteriia bacterium]MCL2870976.1 type II toxin-antitoxin system prevent-host-death family antitoxin [Coriobacteriia bacterium]
MQAFAIAEARAQFSSVLERVQAGEEVTITKGRKNEPIVVMIPYKTWMASKPKRRRLGMLSHWNLDVSVPKMSYEDLLRSSEEDVKELSHPEGGTSGISA